MCGVAGFWDTSGQMGEPGATTRRMIRSLVHRGPDGHGIWFDRQAGVSLGHRRLAILDLSPEGHQPMVSSSGRYVISYNGEVYNFGALRAELERQGQAFRGHSDTEVMLAAIEHWGLERAVTLFIGMFAFALWDRQDRKLFLVRDRLGIKPLYYGQVNGSFVFASELKAFRAYPGFAGSIDRGALALLLRHNYIPAPYSIYEDIRKLLPGHILSLDIGNKDNLAVHAQAYWSARTVAEHGPTTPFRGSPEEAIEQLDTLLQDAVRLRMLADVPLGAFLSGGIDSSTVVALMQAQSSRPVKTFSIGFHETSYNEAEYAKAVAHHLGTEHTELYVTPEDAMQVIPKLPTLFDEPFSDSSQIPTFLVSQLARKHVTVSLSGDGGDELFYGYDRYAFSRRIWQAIAWMPWGARTWLGCMLTAASQRMRSRKLNTLAEVLSMDGPDALYQRVVSHWKDSASVVLNAEEPVTALTDPSRHALLPNFDERMMFLDMVSYLPDDILVKVDRASMGASLEARVPLLDHRVIEFAWRLPLGLKYNGGRGKWILRQVLDKYVPRELINRPKVGFGVPIKNWLRGPLREWAEAMLDEHRLHEEGYFDPVPIRKKWLEHQEGDFDWHFYLWDVLMFQAWLKRK